MSLWASFLQLKGKMSIKKANEKMEHKYFMDVDLIVTNLQTYPDNFCDNCNYDRID